MRYLFRPLILAAACLLFGASAVEARQPYRTSFPRPAYTPIRPAYPGVYVYPQINTSPYYYTYPYTPYYPSWYGVYNYTPGFYGYSYSPWGTSYYYTNPSFYYRYRIW